MHKKTKSQNYSRWLELISTGCIMKSAAARAIWGTAVRGSYGVMQGNPDNAITGGPVLEQLAHRWTYLLIPSGNLVRVSLGQEWSEIGLFSSGGGGGGGETGAHLLTTTQEPGWTRYRSTYNFKIMLKFFPSEPELSFHAPHFVPTAPSVTSRREPIEHHSENSIGPSKNVTAADQVAVTLSLIEP